MSADPNPEIVAPGILGRILAVYGRTQFLRYLIFSGLAAVTNFGVGVLLYDVAGWDGPVSYKSAVTIGFLAGMAVSYLLNRAFTFSRSGRRTHQEIRTFIIVSMGGLLLTVVIAAGLRTAVMPLLAAAAADVPILGPVLANGEASGHFVAIGLVAFYSFACHKFFTFNKGITAVLRRLLASRR